MEGRLISSYHMLSGRLFEDVDTILVLSEVLIGIEHDIDYKSLSIMTSDAGFYSTLASLSAIMRSFFMF